MIQSRFPINRWLEDVCRSRQNVIGKSFFHPLYRDTFRSRYIIRYILLKTSIGAEFLATSHSPLETCFRFLPRHYHSLNQPTLRGSGIVYSSFLPGHKRRSTRRMNLSDNWTSRSTTFLLSDPIKTDNATHPQEIAKLPPISRSRILVQTIFIVFAPKLLDINISPRITDWDIKVYCSGRFYFTTNES